MNSRVDPFNTIIPSEYIFSKNKPVIFHLRLHKMNLDYFASKVEAKFLPKGTYTVFIKVKYNKDKYFMGGNQLGFTFNSEISI